MEDEYLILNFNDLLYEIRKNIKKILYVSVLGGLLIGFVVAFTKNDKKSTYVDLYVTLDDSFYESFNLNKDNINRVMDNVKNLLISNEIISEATNNDLINVTEIEAKANLSASASDNSNIVRFSCNLDNEKDAKNLLNIVVNSLDNNLSKYKDIKSIEIINGPVLTKNITKYDNFKKYGIVGVAVTFICYLFFIACYLMMDGKIRNEKDIKRIFDIPIISTIKKDNIELYFTEIKDYIISNNASVISFISISENEFKDILIKNMLSNFIDEKSKITVICNEEKGDLYKDFNVEIRDFFSKSELDILKKKNDYILIDTPSINKKHDYISISNNCDVNFLIINYVEDKKKVLERINDEKKIYNIRINGIIFNELNK